MRPDDYAVDLSLVEPLGPDGRLPMAPGETRPVYVEVANRGGATWRWGLEQQPEIRVAYHWRAANGDVTDFEGLRSPLPCALGPGDATIVPVWVRAPAAGDHTLEVDLVHEHVRWFEAPLEVRVSIRERRAADDPTHDAPHADRPQPETRRGAGTC
jgi:hypothetical protein